MRYHITMVKNNKWYFLSGYSMEGGETECHWTTEPNHKMNFPNHSYVTKVLNSIGRGTIGTTDDYDEDERWN